MPGLWLGSVSFCSLSLFGLICEAVLLLSWPFISHNNREVLQLLIYTLSEGKAF